MVDDEEECINPGFSVLERAMEKLWVPAPIGPVERKYTLVRHSAVQLTCDKSHGHSSRYRQDRWDPD